MHKVTLQITKVFDCVRTGKHGVDTLFSFKTAGKRFFNVKVFGHPRIEAGMTITAILQKPDNWQTLWGWLDHDTGALVMPRLPVIRGFFTVSLSLLFPLLIISNPPLAQDQHGILVPITIACIPVLFLP